jgi:hypothetical protein
MTTAMGSPPSNAALAGPECRRCSPLGAAFSSLSLARKMALIPALTLLLLGPMLADAPQMGEHNTAALRAVDRDGASSGAARVAT